MAYTYIYIINNINTYNMHIYMYIHTYTFIDQIRASPADVGPVGFVDLTSPAPRCRKMRERMLHSFARCPTKKRRVRRVFFLQGTSPR